MGSILCPCTDVLPPERRDWGIRVADRTERQGALQCGALGTVGLKRSVLLGNKVGRQNKGRCNAAFWGQ